ncbi:DnaA/Hda family protein [Chitinilyticum aquatile]|uniref:DnaA/Hda family protein n=1 Tax=Chitinilyticum aquatile TaxID=362520 RepID=UPI000686F35E|nr:DnaA/Hda family protein [Chitinilyticum aquatile]
MTQKKPARPDRKCDAELCCRIKQTGLIPHLTFDTWVSGISNQQAEAAVQHIMECRNNTPLYIYGGIGLGKTHLMHAAGHRIHQLSPGLNIRSLSAERLELELLQAIREKTIDNYREISSSIDLFLLDSIHFLASRVPVQEEVLRLFKIMQDNGHRIIITGESRPAEIPDLQTRLVDYLSAGEMVDIRSPDHDMRVKILLKAAAVNQDTIDDQVAEFIAARFHDCTRELLGALIRVQAYARLIQQPITCTLAQSILGD